MSKPMNQMPHWPDARGWIGVGIFALSVMLLWMMKDRQLREDEFFQTIATVIIANGLMAVVAWAYSATKGGGELAEKNADLVHKATVSKDNKNTPPQDVVVVNKPDDPVPTVPKSDEEELPEYARG